jgi:type I restriction-modification system DNA methylase subunit
MYETVLRAQLQQPYRRDSWRAILPKLLPAVDFFAQPQPFPLTTERERSIATGRRQIGVASIPDQNGGSKKVAIYEIDVATNVDLPRNRVALRELVARSIDQVSAHAVLAFFIQPDCDEYRLTYAARESELDLETFEIKTRETAPKRFTFLLGPTEPCRTAVQRLTELAAKRDSLTFRDVERAFSVERLNKEFFAKYKQHYQRFVDYLIDETDAPGEIFGVTVAREDEEEFDRACKPLRDFVKRLLGRIVFLHFLQRKGWLGCDPRGEDWKDGDRDFMLHYFERAEQCGQVARFHSHWLTPLFFNALNNPERPHDLFEPTGTRIPYLNGGLFEEVVVAVRAIDFPENFFRDLLEFFAEYNFTIDENDPEENEVGIDPEMLGHIFENLLEDNKDKGAYYTPKPVVQYMCQQSLIHYLCAPFADENAEGAKEIERFIRNKDPIDPRDTRSWISRNARRIDELLDSVRICDPAIGSGAFPMGLLQEIYWIKLTLHPGAARAPTKRAIIQQSIHGVDIDAGAVEIARLRCWLALIVDEEVPLPLPNLDYQIMQGNSLLESFEGESLQDLDQPIQLGVRRILGSDQHELDLKAGQIELVEEEATTADSRQNLAELREHYFACHDPAEKEQIRRKIDIAALHALDARLDRRREELEHSLAIRRAEEANKLSRAKNYRTPLAVEKKLTQDQTELDSLEGKRTRLHSLLADAKAERPFFLWHFWFRDVFANGGFDIVIANPPYGADLGNANVPHLVRSYEVAAANPESYALFIELALRVTRPTGIICMIVATGWYSGVSFKRLRRFFATATDPLNFVNLPYDVFEDAWIDTGIFVTSKREVRTRWPRKESAIVALRPFGKRDQIKSVDPFFEDQKIVDFAEWFEDSQDLFLTFASAEMLNVLKKITRAGKPLTKMCDVQRGVTPFDILEERINKTSKRAFRGTVRRYRLEEGPVGYIQFDDSLAEPKPEKYFNGQRLLLRELISRQFQLQVTITSQNFVTNKSMQSILKRRNCPDLRYVLGILNSRLMCWFFLTRSNIANRDDFPKIVLQETRQLPIAKSRKNQQRLLIGFVNRILAAKRAGDEAAAGALETEIDEIVYRLYSLTSEEIDIIENSLPR